MRLRPTLKVQTQRSMHHRHLLEAHFDFRTIQALRGPADVSMTMRYAHVLNRGGCRVRSLADGVRCGTAAGPREPSLAVDAVSVD